MNTEKTSYDIGDIAIGLTFRSGGYFILANMVMMVSVALCRTAGWSGMSDTLYWSAMWGLWIILTTETLWRVSKLKGSGVTITNSTFGIHALEVVVAIFLGLYALARPYLIESDASGYPYVTAMFQILLGIMAFYHILLIAIFKTRTTWKDYLSLAIALAVGVVAAFR